MESKIEILPPCQIAYIRQIGPYGANNKRIMENLKNWARLNGLLDDASVILGIAQDDPAVTTPENCRYDVCLVVKDNAKIQDDYVCIGTIPGGKYAVFTMPHTSEAISKAWGEIFPELQRLEYQWDGSRPIVERYAARLVNAHQCEICVPIL